MTSFTINTILEKTVNRDKDFRYMATSDLLTELQKESFKPDSDGEKKICKAILKLLNDQSSDVQGLAVKCLSPLVRKVHDQQVDEIMLDLCSHVLTGKEEQRDICSIGLKTVVIEMPNSMGPAAVRQLTARLVTGLKQDVLEVKIECMDILNELLKRFGSLLKKEEAQGCLEALFTQLDARVTLRKRSIACIASLSASLTDKLLSQLIGSIVSKMNDKAVGLDLRRTYIQTLSAISRSGSYRLCKQLDLVVPIVLAQCEGSKVGGDPELIESCLQAFESFVMRCPKEVQPYEEPIAKSAQHYLSFDPNYADDDEDMEDEDQDDDMEDEDEDDAEYSDDDDVSWKVRRAAAKVLSAIIVSRPERLAQFVTELAPVLITCFKEREENVKMDVFTTFNDLLIQVGAARQLAEPQDESRMAVDGAAEGPGGAAASQLMQELPRLIKAICRQLKAKSVKTRVAAFGTLRQLATVLPGCLVGHAVALVPGIERALKDATSNNLRIEVLSFLQQVLASHPPETMQPHLALLLPKILTLVGDRYYKLTAEALRVTSEVVRVLRPDPPAISFAFEQHVGPILSQVKERLIAQDQDQEVKECAITCMGLTLYHLGDACTAELPTTLPILLERLHNELTRVTAVKAFAMLAAAKIDVQLHAPLAGTPGSVLQAVVAELASFLRKSNRPLRQASLGALETIIAGHGAQLGAASTQRVLEELPALVSDGDLHIAHLGLVLTTTVVRVTAESTVPQLGAAFMPRVYALVHSSLLQGHALRSLLAFLAELVRQNKPQLNFDVLTGQLLGLASSGSLSKHAMGALSQAIATCCTNAPQPQERDNMVKRFIGEIGANEPQAILALHCLGEVGSQNDLSGHVQLVDKLMEGFASSSDEVKNAAAFALGNIAAGNMPFYLPHLLGQVKSSQHEYLMLYALKDMVSACSSNSTSLAEHVDHMLPCLFGFAERDEEGVRNVVAECLGKLAAVASEAVLPRLEERLVHPSAFTRAAVVNSVRFTITEPGGTPVPSASMHKFLSLLSDDDLKVRRGALLALNCVAHNQPGSVREMLDGLLPMLYAETTKKAELVHQVDLGPFKHMVDDGLELRKAAFECMDSLLDTLPERLEHSAFIERLVDGLRDDHDIRVLCHTMLGKLAVSSGAPALLAALELITEPLRLTLSQNLKDNAVKQQIDRHEELLRSAMRAARALEKLVEAGAYTKFDDFVRATLRGGKHAEKYAAIVAEEQTKPSDES